MKDNKNKRGREREGRREKNKWVIDRKREIVDRVIDRLKYRLIDR